MMKFPLLHYRWVYHIGTLNPEHKRRGSLEGSGLSVSRHPREWIRIAQLGGNPVWEMHNDDGVFVDAHKLNETHWYLIETWAIKNGWATREHTYRVWQLDEDGEEYYLEFLDYDEAMDEAGDEDAIEERKAIVMTQALAARMNTHVSPILTPGYLVAAYAEDNLDVDGVWWDDELDVLALSAPRGVIFADRVSDWDAVDATSLL
jgi:hypothetical protein